MTDETPGASLVVEDAIEPVSYRLSPDTLLSEVIEIIVKRRVGALPVVGESSEVWESSRPATRWIRCFAGGARRRGAWAGEAPDGRAT